MTTPTRAAFLLASLSLLLQSPGNAQSPAPFRAPYLESHTGSVLLTVAVSSAGILGLSTAINNRKNDSPNQKRGTLTHTLPIAWLSAAGGAALTRHSLGVAGFFVTGGVLGGALGRRAGTRADLTGKDTDIDIMTVATVVGAALIVGAAYAPIGD